jgi:hypothetical protein
MTSWEIPRKIPALHCDTKAMFAASCPGRSCRWTGRGAMLKQWDVLNNGLWFMVNQG